jgi:hypothetical protein
MTELMGGGEPLNAHRPLCGDKNARRGIAQIGAKKCLEGAQEQREIKGLDSAEHVNITARVDLLAQI